MAPRISDVADSKAALLYAVNARKEASQSSLGRERIVRNQLIQDFVNDPELFDLRVAFVAALDTCLRVSIDTPIHFGGNVTQLD